MNKQQRIFYIDVALVVIALLSVYSGFELHTAGHGHQPHDIWHNWAVVHSIVSVLFLLVGGWHVWEHRLWYKSWFTNKHKGKRTAVWVLTVFFGVVSLSGIALFAVTGANSALGFIHYGLGIGLGACSLFHIARRYTFYINNKHKL